MGRAKHLLKIFLLPGFFCSPGSQNKNKLQTAIPHLSGILTSTAPRGALGPYGSETFPWASVKCHGAYDCLDFSSGLGGRAFPSK